MQEPARGRIARKLIVTDQVAWFVGLYVGLSVCLSVCLSICHTSELCKNDCTDQDAVWVEDSDGP